MRVKCLAQEHNTMSPARARAQTAHSGVKRTNHEATMPPTLLKVTLTQISEGPHLQEVMLSMFHHIHSPLQTSFVLLFNIPPQWG